RGYLVLLAIVIIVVVGAFWYQDYVKYQQVPEETGPEFLEFVDRGLDEELQAKYDLIIAELEASIADQGEMPNTGDLLNLGNAYYAVGELGKAKDTYARILIQSPDDVPALENIGTTLYAMGDYYGAEDAWVAATELAGNESHILRLVDLINEHIPEHKDRIKPMLELSIAQLGQTPGLLTELGEWYFEQGDYDRAISHYQVALTVDPDSDSIKKRLAEIRAVRSNSMQGE
ncbi:MAG: tetratricopeptide repeat protein, partial [Candidatus Uhrbacteria bacterium]|nr:tetratricopeptide repeat protein [Patescibacteria group bacterium]